MGGAEQQALALVMADVAKRSLSDRRARDRAWHAKKRAEKKASKADQERAPQSAAAAGATSDALVQAADKTRAHKDSAKASIINDQCLLSRAPMPDPWAEIKAECERRRLELIEAHNASRRFNARHGWNKPEAR